MARNILVVEDDRNISDLIRMYLEKEGFDVRIAYDGGKAVEEFDREAPDMVLLDIMLPVMDGWAVCAHIREKAKTPIIMLTAKSEVNDRITGLEMGADDYLMKPFSPRELVARVNAIFRRIDGNGKEVKIGSPLDAMKLGMAYLPEDRKAEGIIADLSVRENIIIAMQAKKGMFHPMSRKEMEEAADKYIDMLQIKTASRETPIKSLSGGNQQKVILGRWLLTNPEYLILDEPTRGIDIGTKTEIQKIVLDLADQGMAVTFISSEVEEMLRTCSRMAVLRDGEKVGELEESELSQSNIMKAIAGGDDKNE